MRPKRSITAFAADSASAALVTSSLTTNRLADAPMALDTLSVFRPVATTLWPAARAALAKYKPMPRPAPVISHTCLFVIFLSPQKQLETAACRGSLSFPLLDHLQIGT